jgi:hypothetical protein
MKARKRVKRASNFGEVWVGGNFTTRIFVQHCSARYINYQIIMTKALLTHICWIFRWKFRANSLWKRDMEHLIMSNWMNFTVYILNTCVLETKKELLLSRTKLWGGVECLFQIFHHCCSSAINLFHNSFDSSPKSIVETRIFAGKHDSISIGIWVKKFTAL